ncbi:MAG: DUF4292 domain-containing protein [Bacteroidetes bacterium]|nr:DUF4292 domain-containing protein [Bacteroidota bacterium]
MKNFLYIIITTCILAACAQTKPVVKPREMKQIDRAAIYDTIVKYYGNYKRMNTRFEAQFTIDKAQTIKGNLRIERDSIIWVSITPALNLEAFRIKLTPDSVYMVNRLNKSYYAGTYDIVRRLTGVNMNYQTVQALLLNELIMYPFTQKTDTLVFFRDMNVNNKKTEIELMHKQLLRKNDTLSVQQQFTFDLLYYRLTKTSINDSGLGSKLDLKYEKYKAIDTLSYFPTLQNFEVKDKKNKVKIKLQYEHVRFNEEQTYPFTINEKYNRLF